VQHELQALLGAHAGRARGRRGLHDVRAVAQHAPHDEQVPAGPAQVTVALRPLRLRGPVCLRDTTSRADADAGHVPKVSSPARILHQICTVHWAKLADMSVHHATGHADRGSAMCPVCRGVIWPRRLSCLSLQSVLSRL